MSSTSGPRPIVVTPRGGRRALLVDACIAILLLAVSAVAAGFSAPESAAVTAAGAGSVIAACALAIRRLHPLISAGVIGACGTLILSISLVDPDLLRGGQLAGALGAMVLITLVSLYAVTVYSTPPVSLTALGVAVAAGVVLAALAVPPDGPDRARYIATNSIFAIVLLAGTWAIAAARRSRKRELQTLAERNRALQAEKETSVARAAADERARIAREMHDIVAHSLSAVIAQADGGRYAARSDSDVGVRALEVISSTSRNALTDMRGLLGVLRSDEANESTGPLGVDDLPTLIAAERSHGAQVTLVENGDTGCLPPALDLTVYRIVQESLTNARTHGRAGTNTRVFLHRTESTMTVTIEDRATRNAPAPPDPAPDGGRGIVGMRERATLHGGTLDARATADGFRVVARLPLDPTADRRRRETP